MLKRSKLNSHFTSICAQIIRSNVNITVEKCLLDQQYDADMPLNGIFCSRTSAVCSGNAHHCALPSPPLPHLWLILSSVLFLLNAHYCWSGRAPLNPAGAPLAERSECAALIPLPLCCLAWRHFGGGFRTDNQLWTVDFLSKVSFSCAGDFFLMLFIFFKTSSTSTD